jgi:hypothetical protein
VIAGSEVLWSVSRHRLASRDDGRGNVEVSEDAAWLEVFGRSHKTESPTEAATLVGRYAAEVCSQREWIAAVREA